MTNPNFEVGQGGLPPLNRYGVPIDVAHSHREYVGGGGDELGYNTRREPRMSDPARMAVNLSQPQASDALTWQRRGMPGVRTYPDGGSSGPAQGKIRASHQFGLGPAYARPAAEGHDPVDTTPPTDYLANSGGLDRYVGARSVLPDNEYGSGYPRFHAGSQMPVMGDDIEASLFSRNIRRP